MIMVCCALADVWLANAAPTYTANGLPFQPAVSLPASALSELIEFAAALSVVVRARKSVPGETSITGRVARARTSFFCHDGNI